MLFSHLVMNPLKSLLSAIHNVEAGNWQTTVKIDSNDNLGVIGSSFNYGLRGDEISLKSKIFPVVDTFDAMITDRPYRKALSLSSVKEELMANAGTQFDHYVAGAFVDLLNVSGDALLSSAGYTAVFTQS